MYDPSLSRWTTLDPESFAAGQSNLYEFVGNAPTNERDPSGRAAEGRDAALGEELQKLFLHGLVPVEDTPMFLLGFLEGYAGGPERTLHGLQDALNLWLKVNTVPARAVVKTVQNHAWNILKSAGSLASSAPAVMRDVPQLDLTALTEARDSFANEIAALELPVKLQARFYGQAFDLAKSALLGDQKGFQKTLAGMSDDTLFILEKIGDLERNLLLSALQMTPRQKGKVAGAIMYEVALAYSTGFLAEAASSIKVAEFTEGLQARLKSFGINSEKVAKAIEDFLQALRKHFDPAALRAPGGCFAACTSLLTPEGAKLVEEFVSSQ